MSDVRWLDLDGTANTRDVGGLPTVDGAAVLPRRLLRSDNLQRLSERDLRLLVDEYGVRTVIDLRTGTEVRAEGPGPILAESLVRVEHRSLFPEEGHNTDVANDEDPAGSVNGSGPPLLPWHDPKRKRPDGGPAGVYLRYLDARPDAVLDSVRLMAATDGATLVHCAAGKDRTGMVVAIALAEVGVTREAIIADYARSAERIVGIFARLRSSPTYANDVLDEPDRHAPRAATMVSVLDVLDAQFGGAPAWLRRHGWTDADASALRARLVG